MDEEPCLPVNNNITIHLPDYMTTGDRVHVSANFEKATCRCNEEQAKSIARLYRDRCTNLTTQVAQLQLEQAKLKAAFTDEKNQIRSFWRDMVLEGKSRSGRMLKLGLHN